MTPIRVLIVDDSVVIRRLLSDILGAEPDIDVVGTASNGKLGLERMRQLKPDLVTLDIEMPEMDGLETLVELRREFPKLPVIMFSTLTERGAAATIDALAAGANDYVTKPANVGSTQAAIARVRDDLIPRVKALTRSDPLLMVTGNRSAGRSGGSSDVPALRPTRRARVSLVAIGTSTGGPNALAEVLGGLGADFPVPIVIVQHMPPVFTRLLAERLDAKSAPTVVEAAEGDALRDGWAYVAPGGAHLEVRTDQLGVERLHLTDDPPENFCRPAVDVLFRSAARTHGSGVLGVIMTGMGQDGLIGARALVDAGANVIAQDEATSVVWGMPGFVARDGLASEILPLSEIATTIERRVRPRTPVSAATRARGTSDS